MTPNIRPLPALIGIGILWAALTAILLLCSCAPRKPVLRVIYYDPRNNRVDEKGNLIPWTNWSAGFYRGTNWIKVLEAKE